MESFKSKLLKRKGKEQKDDEDDEITNRKYVSPRLKYYVLRFKLLTLIRKQRDVLEEMPNLSFYSNKISSRPRGDLIDDIHKKWFGEWDLLEEHHGYLSLSHLFKIQLHSMAFSSI